jgi:tetratricopeptide (TPR) repeat protein
LSRRKRADEVPSSSGDTRQRSVLRWLGLAVLIGGGAVAGAVGVSWWQDRPLAEIEATLASGDARRANQLVGYFLETRPGHPTALALKARTLVLLQQPMEAIELFEQIGAATIDELHAWARAHMLLQQWSEATPLLLQVLEEDPVHEDALYEITSCRTRLRQFQLALESAERFRRVTQEKARADLLIGSIHSDMGNFQPAAVAFAAVLESEPEAANLPVSPGEFFLQYGRVLLMNGQPREALPHLGQHGLLEPTPEGFFLLGNAAEQIGELDRAIEVWMEAVKLDPLHSPTREALAQAALEDGDAAAALRWLEPLVAAKVDRSSTAYLLQRAYLRMERPDESERWRQLAEKFRGDEQREQALNDLLVTAPDSFWARIVLAHQFASEGNWDQASRILAAVDQRGQEDPFVADLAEAVRRRGELPDLARIPVSQL